MTNTQDKILKEKIKTETHVLRSLMYGYGKNNKTPNQEEMKHIDENLFKIFDEALEAVRKETLEEVIVIVDETYPIQNDYFEMEKVGYSLAKQHIIKSLKELKEKSK